MKFAKLGISVILALSLVCSLVPGALAEESPTAQVNNGVDDVYLVAYGTIIMGDPIPDQDKRIIFNWETAKVNENNNKLSNDYTNFKFGNQESGSTLNISSLEALLEMISAGGYTISASAYSTKIKLDLTQPIELHIKNAKGVTKEIEKKLVFAPASEKPEDAEITAVDENDTITIYADNFKFVVDSTAGDPNLVGWRQDYENNTINFKKGIEIQSGATVEFSHLGRLIHNTTHRVSAQMTCVFGDDLVVEEGGTLSVEGHKAPPEQVAEGKTYRGYDHGTVFEFSGTQFQNNGDVTLTGVKVEGKSMNSEPVMVNNGNLTLEERKTTLGEAAQNAFTLVETDSNTSAAIQCNEESTLTMDVGSQVTSQFAKAVDLQKGSTYKMGNTDVTVGEQYYESYVDNSGSLVQKAEEGDLAAKVDKPEVEEPTFDEGVDADEKNTLKTAVESITAEWPTSEQENVAAEWADADQAETVKGMMKGEVSSFDTSTEVFIHVVTTVETKVEEYSKTDGVLKLDITPKYQVIATTAADKSDINLPDDDGTTNAVPLTEKKDLEVNQPVTMSIPLPSGFVEIGTDKVAVIHEHEGTTYIYQGNYEASSRIVTFDNPHGFSTFTFVALKRGMLSNLSTDQGTMETFNPGKDGRNYTIYVPNGVSSLNLTATTVTSDTSVSAKLGETDLNVYNNESERLEHIIVVSNLVVGENTVQITVGSGSTYTVTIVRAAYVPPTPSTYTVSAEEAENAEVELSTEKAAAGDSVTVTVTPAENFHVSGVTVTGTDGKEITVVDNGDGTFTFTMPSGGVTVKAETFKCPSVEYTDIDVTEWYHDYVDYAITHDLMDGFGDGVFAPEKTVTRAQMAGILWNLEGQPVVNYLMTFTDVPDGKWYTEAIRWAASEGIISGYGDNTFKPEDIITREQMAAMLYFYEEYKNGDHTVDAELTFTDSGEVSSWANEAVVWCVGKDLIHGKGDNAFDPRGTSIRAQLATLLALYDQMDK